MKELTYEIIGTCGQNCDHCSSRSDMGNKQICSIDDFKKNLDNFDNFDYIRLSGGEPFLHPNIVEIVNYVHKKGKHLQILSSGTFIGKDGNPEELSNETLKKISQKVSKIIFSNYGFPNTHEQIVDPVKNGKFFGFPYWNIMMDSIRNVLLNGMNVGIQSVILKNGLNKEEYLENLENLFWQVNFLNKNSFIKDKILSGKEGNVNLHFLRYINQGRGKDVGLEAFSSEELNEIMEKIKDFAKKYEVETSWSSNIEFNHCDCSKAKMVIQPNGNIISCSALKGDSGITKGAFACTPRL